MNRREFFTRTARVATLCLCAQHIAFSGMQGNRSKRPARRASVKKDDHGYPFYVKSLRERNHLRVFLNGHPVNRCITADERLGMVEYYPVDASGHVILHDPTCGEIKRHREYGRVRILFDSELAQSEE